MPASFRDPRNLRRSRTGTELTHHARAHRSADRTALLLERCGPRRFARWLPERSRPCRACNLAPPIGDRLERERPADLGAALSLELSERLSDARFARVLGGLLQTGAALGGAAVGAASVAAGLDPLTVAGLTLGAIPVGAGVLQHFGWAERVFQRAPMAISVRIRNNRDPQPAEAAVADLVGLDRRRARYRFRFCAYSELTSALATKNGSAYLAPPVLQPDDQMVQDRRDAIRLVVGERSRTGARSRMRTRPANPLCAYLLASVGTRGSATHGRGRIRRLGPVAAGDNRRPDIRRPVRSPTEK